ncbi:hypothetical protein ES711_13790 [Gelidibacter salicanalis]|uniref:Uncharacterized protein n=1 Tax=Gelidibacter salicanalis TaxID=291193 RepID=A0A5C7AL98_9FLAO|nr:hypothetical protein [Gelidibacter salicanalis]TXE06572.1 hypothetical protein ES711_13790 [Gelidibacter salicanalis]
MIITPFLVVLLIIVFVLTYMFVNTIDKRQWITIPLSLILTPFIYFYAFYPLINIFSSYHHEKYFDSEVWHKNPSFRYEMYDNITDTDTLVGVSKPQIKELLGTYEWLTWDDAKKGHDENRWNYGLGILPGAFNSKSEAMEVVFTNDTVSQINTYKITLKVDAKK